MLHQVLLAQSERFFSLSGSGVGTWIIHGIIIVSTAACLWVSINWVDRLRSRRRISNASPQALFLELCQAHRLGHGDQQLLWAVASSQCPDRCCRIFIDPDILSGAVRSSKKFDVRGCQRLASRLFGLPLSR
jgi:hypothetical protein